MNHKEFIAIAGSAKESLRDLSKVISKDDKDHDAMDPHRQNASSAIGSINPQLNQLSKLIRRKRNHGNGQEYDIFENAIAAHWSHDLDSIYTAINCLDQAIGIVSQDPNIIEGNLPKDESEPLVVECHYIVDAFLCQDIVDTQTWFNAICNRILRSVFCPGRVSSSVL